MSLADRLARQIQTDGPMPLEQFLEQVISDSDGGYYATEDRFGQAGDFITAPEISQLFGEMLAAFLSWLWQASGHPEPEQMVLFEAGPGRGTLFADMHRTYGQICPQLAAAQVVFLENSPYLKAELAKKFKPMDISLQDKLEPLPEKAIFGVANEFFDALAIRQAIKTKTNWVWRSVATRDSAFEMAQGAPLTNVELNQYGLDPNSALGTLAEFSPTAESLMAQLARHVTRFGGGVLICDYGKAGPEGDSLQAVRDHKPVPILDQLGRCDISHLVDFAALARSAENQGARLIGPVEQGTFLRELGIEARAEALRRHDGAHDRGLLAALDRLCAPSHMGRVFKVALLAPVGEGLPAGFSSLCPQESG